MNGVAHKATAGFSGTVSNQPSAYFYKSSDTDRSLVISGSQFFTPPSANVYFAKFEFFVGDKGVVTIQSASNGGQGANHTLVYSGTLASEVDYKVFTASYTGNVPVETNSVVRSGSGTNIAFTVQGLTQGYGEISSIPTKAQQMYVQFIPTGTGTVTIRHQHASALQGSSIVTTTNADIAGTAGQQFRGLFQFMPGKFAGGAASFHDYGNWFLVYHVFI